MERSLIDGLELGRDGLCVPNWREMLEGQRERENQRNELKGNGQG